MYSVEITYKNGVEESWDFDNVSEATIFFLAKKKEIQLNKIKIQGMWVNLCLDCYIPMN